MNFKKKLLFFFSQVCFFNSFYLFSETLEEIFADLKKNQIIKEIDLPVIYNTQFMTGYLNMPSANCAKEGNTEIGYAYFYPYQNIGVNFQVFPFVEGAFNYKIFTGRSEENFGKFGFGDDADRMVNVKFIFDPRRYFKKNLPSIALGFDDFYGSQRFFAPYVAITQQHKNIGLEYTLGYGFHHYKGAFFGLNYTPFIQHSSAFLKGSTFILEYDATDYEKHQKEHPEAREVLSRWNIGYSLNFLNIFDFKIASNRGKELLLQGGIHYNIGETKGLFPKINDPSYYSFPKNFQSIGPLRTEKEAAYHLSYALGAQGFYVTHIYLLSDENHELNMQIDLINLRYFRNKEVKKRIFEVIKNLFPQNLAKITVTIHENSIPIESYVFTKDMMVKPEELFSAVEAVKDPTPYEGKLLFNRKKTVSSWLIRPRLISFFGSISGKYKYALSLIGGPQGYILDKFYYKILLSYNIKSSIQKLLDYDFYDPSQILAVRSDSVRYFQSQTVNLEQAYIQRGLNLGKGFYIRGALGYFEPAYAGFAFESLYFPVNANFALGIEAATVLKRNYQGIGFQRKIRKLSGLKREYVPYVGLQYFLDGYYVFQPFQLEFKVSIGQFLAKDKGVRLDIGKYYPSGLRIGYWTTITNAKDTVHGKIYYDKGISFQMPLDIFLTKSSRNMLGYGIAFWLRDCGAKAATGKELYQTLIRAREY